MRAAPAAYLTHATPALEPPSQSRVDRIPSTRHNS